MGKLWPARPSFECRSQIGVAGGRSLWAVPRVPPTCGPGVDLSRAPLGGSCTAGRTEPDRWPTSPFPPHRGMREALHVKLSKRSGALIATGVAGAMLLTACGGGSDNGGGSGQGGRVVYGETTTWPENLFPLIS